MLVKKALLTFLHLLFFEEMLTMSARCEGAFIGHALASQYDPSVFMAANISQSLIEQKNFNGPDILARHLHLYYTHKCEIGEITKYIYQQAVQYKGQEGKNLTRDDFRFSQSTIDQFVKAADEKFGGNTSGCGPAQRSYPLAFCTLISDNDLYDLTMLEAKLTHFSPIAGQVAGIVNRICRFLLKNQSWIDAISSAFVVSNLHPDIISILGRYGRFATPAEEKHAAYAPTVLNAALHYVTRAKDPEQAIAEAIKNGKHYCVPLVGILAGARWGIPMEFFEKNINDQRLIKLRETASALSDFSKTKSENVSN